MSRLPTVLFILPNPPLLQLPPQRLSQRKQFLFHKFGTMRLSITIENFSKLSFLYAALLPPPLQQLLPQPPQLPQQLPLQQRQLRQPPPHLLHRQMTQFTGSVQRDLMGLFGIHTIVTISIYATQPEDPAYLSAPMTFTSIL